MSTVVPFPGAQTAHKRLNSGSNGSCTPMPASTLAALSRTLIREHQAPQIARRTREKISIELETLALDLERKSDALKRVGADAIASALKDAAEILDLASKMMECE